MVIKITKLSKMFYILLVAILLPLLSSCVIKDVQETPTPIKVVSAHQGDIVDANEYVPPVNSDVKYTWSSILDAIAKVDENGIIECISPGQVLITRQTENNQIDQLYILILHECDYIPILFRIDFVRVRMLTEEEYNNHMISLYDISDPELLPEYFEYYDATINDIPYQVIYVEVMEYYSEDYSLFAKDNDYKKGKIVTLAIPDMVFDLYKDYDELIIWARSSNVKCSDYDGNIIKDKNIDMKIIYFENLKDYYDVFPISNDKIHINELKEAGIDINSNIISFITEQYDEFADMEIKDGMSVTEFADLIYSMYTFFTQR